MKITGLILCAALLAHGGVHAADPVRKVRVELAVGAPAQKLSGKIKGYESVDYTFDVAAGQTVMVALKTSNTSNYFNVSKEGADEALFVGSRDGDSYKAVVQAAGTYKVRVYLMRNAARKNATANYVLDIGGK